MPISKQRSTNVIRRQSFSGKDLTFIEVVFNREIAETATTPESEGSVFQQITNVIQSGCGNGGSLLACSYYLDRKANAIDTTAASGINDGGSIDVYQYIVEGGIEQFDEPATAGATTSGTTAQSGAIVDLKADIEAILSEDSTTNDVGVIIRTLPSEGSNVLADATSTFIGMFDGRGAE
jgi:hypothetical protein|tara:strand:- start:198 stop:734 length:537 start_codon:yes stop_codon:yes gene_type:complete